MKYSLVSLQNDLLTEETFCGLHFRAVECLHPATPHELAKHKSKEKTKIRVFSDRLNLLLAFQTVRRAKLNMHLSDGLHCRLRSECQLLSSRLRLNRSSGAAASRRPPAPTPHVSAWTTPLAPAAGSTAGAQLGVELQDRLDTTVGYGGEVIYMMRRRGGGERRDLQSGDHVARKHCG